MVKKIRITVSKAEHQHIINMRKKTSSQYARGVKGSATRKFKNKHTRTYHR